MEPCWCHNCCRNYIMYLVKGKQKIILNKFCLITLFFVVFVYSVNTFIIKPNLNERSSFFAYFMWNYFNDIWAGSFIASLANFLLLKKSRYFGSVYFYILFWIVESLTWEFFRPILLTIFNPFNKTPKMLFGDFFSYALGTFAVFISVRFFSKKYEF